jgi:stage II sporulation protein D
MKKRWLTVCLLLLAAPSVPRAQEPLRLRLYWTQPPLNATFIPLANASWSQCAQCPRKPLSAPMSLAARGNILSGVENSRKLLEARGEAARFHGRLRVEVAGHPAFDYEGELRAAAEEGRLAITALLPREEYVAAVLAGESSVFKSEEALKAMAIAARTFSARFAGRHRAEGFDFCDTTHCQDARLGALGARVRSAAEATQGELLWYEGRPAETYYHRDCGGTTEAIENAWKSPRVPYLRQRRDEYCEARGRGQWRSQIRKSDLERALREAGVGAAPRLASVEIASRTPSGRVARLKLNGGGSEIPAEDFRRAVGMALGWEKIRSDLYELHDEGDMLLFRGFGAGHGVGLCQRGAAQMGEAGRTAREILAYYYPGTRPGVTAQGLEWNRLGGERVEVWTTRPNEDCEIAAVAESALRRAEARAGMGPLAAGARVRVQFYPSVAAYRDATGQPGWIAAWTRGRTIRAQPAQVLRSQRVLESTLEHEMLHVLLEARARPGLPMWFREGLALALEGGAPQGREEIAAISDEELAKLLLVPASRAEQQRAFRAARARVEKLIREHGREAVLGWLERGLPRGI